MKDKIPEFLKKEFLKYRSNIDSFSLEIKEFMREYSNYYEWGFCDDFKKIFAVMKKGISELPFCGVCGCENRVYFVHYLKLTTGCCLGHSQEITFIKKYGSTNPMKTKAIQDKVKSTMLEKYGVEHALQNEEVKKKIKKTNIEKYGVCHPMKTSMIQQKVKNSTRIKYGVDNIFQLDSTKRKIKQWRENNIDIILEKSRKTMMKNFGVEYPMQSDEIIKKIKSTMLEKYGVEHNMQSPELFLKNQKAMYKKKEYLWVTGEISLVQGYEPIVLKELEQTGYTFKDVLTAEIDMPEIWYFFENEKHRYYPDMFIPVENLLIEVKSPWTLQLHWEKNQAKFAAVKELGYNFKLEIR